MNACSDDQSVIKKRTDIKNGDHLNSFMEWSVDLQDAYIEEAYKITEAFEEKTGL